MEPKKNPKFDLEKKRVLFIQIGLAVSLLIVLGAFEYRTYEKSSSSLGDITLEAEWEEEIDVTFREKKPPPPPPPPPEIIEIVKDDVEVEEVEIADTESDEDTEIEEEEEETDEIFMVAEQMPTLNGCTNKECTESEIFKHIKRNTKYPPIAKENNITGRIFISFVVDKSGNVTSVKILKGVDKYLDAEALRVVKSMPKFKPGRQRGKPVNVQYNIPFTFKLN